MNCSPADASPTRTQAVRVPRVALPRPDVDVARWAVIACDQFTAQPDYWDAVESAVGDAPSTLRMILPELHLHSPEVDERIAACQDSMRRYQADGLLVEHEALVYVEREVSRGVQRGLLVELDLDAYDFSPTATTLIRSTEGTVIDRLPPRVAVRRDAELELPHVLVLYDDPEGSVLAPVDAGREHLTPTYDTDLMGGSGHITGSLITDAGVQDAVLAAVDALVTPEAYASRYGLAADAPLLLAVGDGNHSLAAAATIWAELKASGAGPEHPGRYALVELVNLHDASLQFEPIHRLVTGGVEGLADELIASVGGRVTSVADADEARAVIASASRQAFALVSEDGIRVVDATAPTHQLAVGTVQAFLDRWLPAHLGASADYVHDGDVVEQLGRQPGAIGIWLPAIAKKDFFASVAVDGPFPRKTFSMGHAHDKRFYLECRRIRP